MTTGTPGSTWETIVQRALLGTERAASSSTLVADGELGSLLGQIDPSSAESALLDAAALVGAYEAAGRLPAKTSSTPATPATPEAEDLPPVPPRVARFLPTMLAGTNAEVLPEWIAAASARGWRVPTPLLPAILDAGHKTPALRSAIASVLGERGRWLAARNDDWGYAAGRSLPSDENLQAAWQTGTPDERCAILELTRGRDAVLGRALLEATWPDEGPAQRATLIALLDIGLGSDDEPFLERALDDRRQEVRRIAAELLRRLDGSAMVARMTVRGRAALAWTPGKLLKKAKLGVEPPSDFDATMARDGIEKKPPAGMGERGWWLAQIISAVPPATWTNEWKTTPDIVLAAAAAGDWTQVLTEGWAAAAVRHGDVPWAEALLASGFPGAKPTPLAPELNQLLGVLPIGRREAYIAMVLRDHAAAGAVPAYVAGAEHAWSEKFARIVLDWMRKRVAAVSTKTGTTDWLLRENFPRIALRIPPSLASATEDWPAFDDAGWTRALERFTTVLTFRRELSEELER
jgi:hypothetical protein